MEDTLLSKLTVAQGIIKDSDRHYDIADAAARASLFSKNDLLSAKASL